MRSRPPSGRGGPGASGESGARARFEGLAATALHCPRCRAAMPVRERLLLVLPDGELHEYLCARCLTSLGTRTVRRGPGAP
jgi:hypothetical protein